ncbi:MAG TPA: hypothetical protein VHI71_06265 [Actinomycetota bacterium]|nr:hypothetical protein [Actinomycetota bacterium]
MTTQRSSRTGLATFACATLLLPACEGRDCRETEMDARDAAVVDAGEVTSSGVLEARLVSDGKPVTGRTVLFHVRVDGRLRFAGSAETGSDGVARVDLKDDPVELPSRATADSYRSMFHGDERFCSSRDEADLDLVGAL